ncbi:MAG: phosphoglycerate dehydrogenase [SAR324 cluster bacterium]|nr:phosphoglycerate dehydrogenase [SAR324 cluster bacterium]
MKKKILITGALHQVAFDILDSDPTIEYDYKVDIPREELVSIIGNYDCHISRSESDVDFELLSHADKLSVVARAAVGIGNIDVEEATKKGILVFNTPGKNTNSAAELTLMLMLAVMRNLIKAHNSMAANKWNRHTFNGTELLGKKIGIIGLGNVGHRVARFCNAFDCDVVSYDPYVTAEYCNSHNAAPVSLEEMCKTCDVITIHTPKNAETVNMIGAKEIAMMKDGVILINAARGGLYNEGAVADGLESGKIHGLGLDTWDKEPVVEHPLKKFENVVMTPHIGASTLEAQFRIGSSVAAETLKALRGDIVATPVNLPDIGALSGELAGHYAYLAGKLGSFSRQFMHQEFEPEQIKFLYRGTLPPEDFALIKMSFIKSFLQGTLDETVSYVNVMQIAETKGIHIIENEDKDFSDYDSAIRVEVKGGGHSVTIGGTVLGNKRVRLSYLNGFAFEIDPAGCILSIENQDQPGVIGHVGQVLAENGVNINRFELSRASQGGAAMAMVTIDGDANQKTLDELTANEHINRVQVIHLGN